MRNLKLSLALCAALIALPCQALAQIGYGKVQQPWFMQGKISGGISVGSSSVATALPTSGQIARICNTGSVDASLAFGADNTAAAVLATSTTLKAGTCRSYDLMPFSTLFKYVATISASSTTLTVETGIGTPEGGDSSASVVSGTVTANQGTPNTAANGWTIKLTDGTNTAAVKAASTAPTATDPAAVVSLSPNSGGSGNITQSAVSVTNATTTLATAATFSNFAKVCVALGASTGIWVNWAGAAAVTAAPSEYIPPGQCDIWVKSTGYLPTQQWNAISNSASTIAVTLIGN